MSAVHPETNAMQVERAVVLPHPAGQLTCSVVIPTQHRPLELDRCLRAVANQDYPRFDVIVVDNTRGDSETRDVAERWEARYVIEPNRGLCRARNRGALVSSSEIIAYLDDDSIPEPDWLRGMAEAFHDSRVMGVAGRTVPLKVETESERLFADLRGSAYTRPHPRVVDRSNPNWFEICGFGGIGPGCNMAIRRTAFEFWPGFNERTDRGTPVYGGGEQHAFFSLVDQGYRVAYTPTATVRHPFPPTMEHLRTRYLNDLTASTAYFTMLVVEASGHRMRTLRYILEGLQGKPRVWRGTPPAPSGIVSRRERLLALARGPFQYLRGRLDGREG